jgi:hypothetical protein
MARLKVKSDCNVNPPDGASAVLIAPVRHSSLAQPSPKPPHHSSAPGCRQLEVC